MAVSPAEETPSGVSRQPTPLDYAFAQGETSDVQPLGLAANFEHRGLPRWPVQCHEPTDNGSELTWRSTAAGV